MNKNYVSINVFICLQGRLPENDGGPAETVGCQVKDFTVFFLS